MVKNQFFLAKYTFKKTIYYRHKAFLLVNFDLAQTNVTIVFNALSEKKTRAINKYWVKY